MFAKPEVQVVIWQVPLPHAQLCTLPAFGFCDEHASVGFISSDWPLQLSSRVLQISACEPGAMLGTQVLLPPLHWVWPCMQTPDAPLLQGRLLRSPGSSIVPLQSSSRPLQLSWTVPGNGWLQVS
jgi:hypothetical protein